MGYVIFRSFDNYIYANILLLRLKNEGIDCHIKDENTITIDPLLSPALGGMKIMVSETDLPKANAILYEFEETSLQALVCPGCGRSGTFQRIVKKLSSGGFLSSVISRLISGSDNSKTVIYRCHNCGFFTKDISSIPEKDF